jgi:hypothetical protein
LLNDKEVGIGSRVALTLLLNDNFPRDGHLLHPDARTPLAEASGASAKERVWDGAQAGT